jgi:hypothetical protein
VRPDDAGSKQVFVRRVLAWYDGRSVIGDNLTEAINRLFPGAGVDLGEIMIDESSTAEQPDVGGDGDGVEPDSGTDVDTGSDLDTGTDVTVPVTPDENDPVSLLAAADRLFDEADAALTRGDLGEYQSKIREAQDLIARALELLSQ